MVRTKEENRVYMKNYRDVLKNKAEAFDEIWEVFKYHIKDFAPLMEDKEIQQMDRIRVMEQNGELGRSQEKKTK